MCDKKMGENIDAMQNKNLMSDITRGIINTKQQLGLGQGVKKKRHEDRYRGSKTICERDA